MQNKVLVLDLREEKVGSRSTIRTSPRARVQFVFGLADRRSFNIHCTPGQTLCAKRCAPNVVAVQAADRLIADDTLCWMCTTWTCIEQKKPLNNQSDNRTHVRAVNDILPVRHAVEEVYASMCVQACNCQRCTRMRRACHRKTLLFFQTFVENWTWRKWWVTSLFPLRSPCLHHVSSRTKLLRTQ